MTIWGKHRYVVRHVRGHPPAKFGRGAGPGSARKTGSKFGESPKKLPHFWGDREKKVPSGSRGRAAPPPVVASEPTAGCLGSTHPKNDLTRRQLSAISSLHFLKAESLKNSFTLCVSGVARLTPRRDSPRRARSKTARISGIGP
jgi:hypothetical protein